MRYAFVNPSNSCQPIKPLDGGIVMLSIGIACYKYMITYIRRKKMNVLPEKHHGFATNQRVNSATGWAFVGAHALPPIMATLLRPRD